MPFLPFLACAAACAVVGAASPDDPPAPAPPNVLLIVSDDQGWADLGVQGVLDDVRTPHLDRLASEGVRCTAAYVTAPQCSPSRAGILTGRHPQRFGLDRIQDTPLPLEQVTLAERLLAAGYVTAFVGKWDLAPKTTSKAFADEHLTDPESLPKGRVKIPFEAVVPYLPTGQGFQHQFVGERERYFSNLDDRVRQIPDSRWMTLGGSRVDVQTEAALAFLREHAHERFFLCVSYFAPHVPLEASPEVLARFDGDMPERRRHALAMLAAMDRGIGRLLRLLDGRGVAEDTLVVFLSDNGAYLDKTMPDTRPVDAVGWTGSRNDPWIGEKGMLTEGGLRVPFVLRWPAGLPSGVVYERPVSALDIAATASAAAGLPGDELLDGVDLTPFLRGARDGSPHEVLCWRFWNQAAIRDDRYKLLQVGVERRMLFDLASDEHETRDVLTEHPEVAARLVEQLTRWADALEPPGLPGAANRTERALYDHYLR